MQVQCALESNKVQDTFLCVCDHNIWLTCEHALYSGALVQAICSIYIYLLLCPQAILPSPCTPADGHKILQTFCKANADLIIFGMTAVASKAFVQTCFELFQPLIMEKAQKVLLTLPPSCFSLVSNNSLFLIC